MQKSKFKDACNCPTDTLSLSVFNFLFSAICFKSLLAFFSYTRLESWVLLGLIVLGFSVSWGIIKVKSWAFGLFHFFVSLVSLAALLHLYFQPSESSYYMFLGTVAYSAVGSFILHRNHYSACFQPKAFACRFTPKYLHAFLNVDGQKEKVSILDISQSGCFFQTQLDLKMGAKCHLEIQFEQFKLFTKGKIMRECSKSHGYGFMFTGFDRRKFASTKEAVSHLYEKMNQFQAS